MSIVFPGYLSMRYAFGQLSGRDDERAIARIFVDTNTLYPPTGRRVYKTIDRGHLFEAFEAARVVNDVDVNDTQTCIQIIDGVEKMASTYSEIFLNFCRSYRKSSITEDVRREMEKSVAFAERTLSDFLDETKPASMDMQLWRAMRDLLSFQVEYCKQLVEGEESALAAFEYKGIPESNDRHRRLQEYLLENRTRYGLRGTSKRVDEMLLAHAVLEAVDTGRHVRIYTADRGLVLETVGLFSDCLREPEKVRSLDGPRIQAALSQPQSAVSLHFMGYRGDMMLDLDTSKINGEPLQPKVMGNWREDTPDRRRPRHRPETL